MVLQRAHGQEKCGICWGSLISTDKEEACSGGGPRMLPCGHLIGRKCLARTFQIGNRCPYCREEYRVSLVRREDDRSFVRACFESFQENTFDQWGWLGLSLAVTAIPLVWAVLMSMDVAPKLNMVSDSQHPLRTRRERMLYAMLIIAISPLIFTAVLLALILLFMYAKLGSYYFALIWTVFSVFTAKMG